MILVESNPLQRVFSETEKRETEKKRQARSPVFILSPAPRCGTNYLAHILLLHTVFQLPTLLWEDHVLAYSQLLEEYARKTSTRWERQIRNDEAYRKDLLRHLGGGILSFLYEHIGEDRRLLCKTPGAHNINTFFLLFPQAKLLILIRDGRDVVESALKTWPHRVLVFERSVRTWAKGARLVLDLLQGPNRELRGRSWDLVRYEDLVQCPEATIRRLLRFLDIDGDSFDMKQIESLPLWGSSVHHGTRDRIHWEPVEKPKEFHPIGRWKSWSYRKKVIFKIIAGRELVQLGYVSSDDW